MATYLQGVTDYIPQYQPFQPDLNFYSNVMQTKQTQYDTNWKALNKMYGQYYHADLTRDENVEKKENYLKNIEFNLKRVSQLDLSLEQNVTQATQIFKPFYEDKGLMKDMAWTKNFNNQYGMAQSYQNAYDDKQRGKYWDTGIREMDYMKDEFKNASSDKAMSFGNVQYTPYVNVIEKAQKIAKDSGLSVETVEFSKDPGQPDWIIKNKNGEALIEPLSKLFEAELGADPGVQAVYKTQAYVNRKDYAYSNAAQFGGDKDKAEMKYLEDSFNTLKQNSIIRHKQLVAQAGAYDKRMQDLQKQVDNGTASPDVEIELAKYKLNKDINDKVLARSEEEQKQLNGDSSSTLVTSTGFKNPYGDIESLRYKVDNGMASSLMQKDLDEAANIFAYKDAKQDIQANPYAVNEQKHMFSMQQIAARNAGLERAARIRNEGESKNARNKYLVDNNLGYYDENGNVIEYEGLNEIHTKPHDESTPPGNLKNFSRQIAKMHTADTAVPYLQNTVELIKDFVRNGQMTEKEAKQILGYGKHQNISYAEFDQKLKGDAYKFIRGEVGSKDLAGIKNKMDSWLRNNKGLSLMSSQKYEAYADASSKFGDYTKYLKADQQWRKDSVPIVVNELSRKGFKNAKYAYNEKGDLRSEKDYINTLIKNKAITKDQAAAYIAQQKEKHGKAGYDAAVKLIGENDYWGAKSAQFVDVLKKAASYYGEMFQVVTNPGEYTSRKAINAMTSKDLDFDYSKLVKAAGDVYSSGKVKAPVGLPQLGEMTGSGQFVANINSAFVNPKDKANRNKGNIFGIEALKNLNNIDWKDDKSNRVTFSGTSLSAWNKGSRNDAGVSLLNSIRAELMNNKSKMNTFEVSVSPLAVGSSSKAAVIIHPDAEWLKGYVYKTDKDGKEITGTGLISPAQYNSILKNGISYITDAGSMNNTLYKSAFKSPLQSYVDFYKEDGYKYSDPADSRYGVQILKNEVGAGDYEFKVSYPVYDPNTGKMKNNSTSYSSVVFGNNLELGRDRIIKDIIPKTKQLNIQNYNGNY
jgi:hypothetical protein